MNPERPRGQELDQGQSLQRRVAVVKAQRQHRKACDASRARGPWGILPQPPVEAGHKRGQPDTTPVPFDFS